MKITKLFLSLTLLALFASCNQSPKTPKTPKEPKIEVSEKNQPLPSLNGYFPKNTITFDEDVKKIIVTNKEDFFKYFGVGKTMANKISEVDFKKNNYAAIVTKPSSKKQLITITNSAEKNGTMTINYNVEESGDQSFESSDVKIITISKSIKSVNFVLNDNSTVIEL